MTMTETDFNSSDSAERALDDAIERGMESAAAILASKGATEAELAAELEIQRRELEAFKAAALQELRGQFASSGYVLH
jgi:hypothetical protein